MFALQRGVGIPQVINRKSSKIFITVRAVDFQKLKSNLRISKR